MSSSEDHQEQPPNEDGADGAGAEDAAAVAMETTTTEDEEPSTWDLAREASSKLVLQSFLDDMETRAAKQKEELQLLRRRAEDAESNLETSRETIQRLEASLWSEKEGKDGLSKKVREVSKEAAIAKESVQTEKERADRSLAESDQLREEISRLTKSNLSYQTQLAEVEAKAKLDDSSLLPLQFKSQRLETENDNLRTHSTWLEGELSRKSEALAELKSSTALESARARASVDAAQFERDELAMEAKQLRGQLDRIQSKTEGLSRQVMEAKQEASDIKLDSEQELTSSRRLITLQKEQILRLEQKHDALAERMTSLKVLAQEAETEDNARWKERESEWEELSRKSLKAQAEDYENRLLSMKEEIETVNSRCKRAEDGLMLIEDAPETAAVAVRAALPRLTNGESSDEPLNMTELYGRVARAEDALHAETIRRKKAEIRVTRIEEEIEANAPFLVRQRKEYELALQRQKELQSRLDNALDEASAIRNESDMMEGEVNRLKKENKDLTEEAKILAKQVRDMLIANSSSEGSDPSVALTVSQMAAANTRLMKEYNALTAKVKELETTLSQRDGLYQEIQDLKAENASLEEQRKREESMVDKIVQQRDLYRVLLNKQDTNLLGNGYDESNALAIVRGQSERTKALEAKHKKLVADHAEVQAKMDLMVRDQETASERLLRYETLNDDLTKSIDKARNEMDKNAATVARSQAEAAFFKEKVQLLEDAQLRNKEEIKNVTASKNRMMTLNTNLEQSLVKANTERSKMEDQLRQAQSRLMMSQAEAESARAAEKRISEESAQLRNELSRQGAVLDGVQRIESSLMMKNNADMEGYKLEVAALKEKLAMAEKKKQTELESAREQIADHELQVKQLETTRVNAAKEALDAKKECVVALEKADAATKKASLLENELRAAKKKLGESGGEDEPDVESELRTKLASLTTDLEGSKKEIETWKKRAATYEKLAKDNEKNVSEITEASNAFKKLHDEDIGKLKEELDRVKTEMSKRKEIITELTNDLSGQREEREKAVNEVKQQITGFKTDAENYQKKAEDAESRYSQLQSDLTVLKADLTEAQTNYERELSLHAAARTDLRTTREENEKANRLRNDAMEEAATLQSKFKIQESSLEAEKSKRKEAKAEFEKKIESTRAENALLHSQLEKINEQIERMQTRYTSASEETESKSEDVSGDEEMFRLKMTVTELRELVKFVRAEKDAIQDQLDSAKRSIERERTKASVARRAVEDAQAELNTVRESKKIAANDLSEGGTSLADKLKTSDDQSRLLSDSNAHLQQQVQDLQSNLASARQQVEESKKALQPAVDIQKQLESDKAVLLAEKESLLREINDWKGRVQSLVSKFNQVDPEEHLKVVKEAEELGEQVKALEEKKITAEEDAKRIRTLASRASSELSKNKQLVESHSKTIAKLTAEKTALVKSQKESVSKKEIDELKEKMAKLEEERKAEKIQAKGSTEMNEKLRNRLRDFQKQILDLRKERTTLTKQLEEARSKTEQKEAEAAKALAALKEKESPMGTSAASGTVDSVTKDTSANNKPATAAPKQAVATTATTSTSSSDSKTPTTTAVEKKEEKKVMPKVPAGGFKFAPSKVVETSNSKKRPATELTKDGSSVSQKKPTGESSVSQKKPTGESSILQKKPTGELQSNNDKEGKLSPTRPTPSNRRNSGELKQMSLKEKLLEKKRKLQELKKAKEALKEETKAAEPVSAEPETKRNRTESTDGKEKAVSKPEVKSDPPALDPKAASFVPNAAALKAAAAKMANRTATVEPSEDDKDDGPEVAAEDGEMEEGEEVTKAKQRSKLDTPRVGGAGSSTASIFGGGSSSQSMFGSGFGKGTTVSGFGSGAASTFGNASAFGSGGTGIGSTGTTSLVFGGSKKADAGSTSAPAASTSGFGSAAFLDIKPPGSSTGSALPQFSFGASGSSITLPTPGAATTPKLTMFNAFGSPAPSQPFGGQAATAKPLFGGTIQEKKDDGDGSEDGELPASEDTNK